MSDSRTATGVMPGDPAAQHVHCDVPLAMDPFVEGYEHHPQSRWRCPGCGSAGKVQYLPAHIQRRAGELPDPPLMQDPPSNPVDWQDYLDAYFSEGVLFLGARDEPGYPVLDTSAYVISDGVRVGLSIKRGAELTIFERHLQRPHTLSAVEALIQIAPGTLVVRGPERRVARLDARLTADEKSYAHRWKNTCYFGGFHPCTAETCPHCVAASERPCGCGQRP